MQLVYIGDEARSSAWREAIARHGRGFGLAAAICGDAGSSPAAAGRRAARATYASLSEALAATRADAAILAGAPVSAAVGALEAGLAVAVEDLAAERASELDALLAASVSSGRPVLLGSGAHRYERRRALLERYLAADRLGAIGQVCCVEHGAAPAGQALGPHAQLLRHGGGTLLALERLLGAAPRSIMAELGVPRRGGARTTAFMALGNGVHVQYFGSIGSAPPGHELWIEGSGGSLRTDGNGVHWRKRGWRFFVPLRLPLGRGAGAAGERAALLGELRETAANPAARADAGRRLLAIVAAAMASAETRRAVDLSAAQARAGAPAPTAAASGGAG